MRWVEKHFRCRRRPPGHAPEVGILSVEVTRPWDEREHLVGGDGCWGLKLSLRHLFNQRSCFVVR